MIFNELQLKRQPQKRRERIQHSMCQLNAIKTKTKQRKSLNLIGPYAAAATVVQLTPPPPTLASSPLSASTSRYKSSKGVLLIHIPFSAKPR